MQAVQSYSVVRAVVDSGKQAVLVTAEVHPECPVTDGDLEGGHVYLPKGGPTGGQSPGGVPVRCNRRWGLALGQEGGGDGGGFQVLGRQVFDLGRLEFALEPGGMHLTGLKGGLAQDP